MSRSLFFPCFFMSSTPSRLCVFCVFRGPLYCRAVRRKFACSDVKLATGRYRCTFSSFRGAGSTRRTRLFALTHRFFFFLSAFVALSHRLAATRSTPSLRS